MGETWRPITRDEFDDLVAEAFSRVLPRWRKGEVLHFGPYLRTAVVNEFRGRLRRESRRSGCVLAARAQGRLQRVARLHGHASRSPGLKLHEDVALRASGASGAWMCHGREYGHGRPSER